MKWCLLQENGTEICPHQPAPPFTSTELQKSPQNNSTDDKDFVHPPAQLVLPTEELKFLTSPQGFLDHHLTTGARV